MVLASKIMKIFFTFMISKQVFENYFTCFKKPF